MRLSLKLGFAIVFVVFGKLGYSQGVKSYTDQGLKLMTLKEYEKAIVLFSNDIENKQADVDTYSGRGLSYFLLQNYQEALWDLNTTITMIPNSDNNLDQEWISSIYKFRGITYYNLEYYPLAIDDLLTSLRLQVSGDAYYYLGVSRLVIKDPKGCKDLQLAAELGHNAAFVDLNEYCR